MPSTSEASPTLHTCSTCSRSFTRIENLRRHQKTLCRKEFSRSDLLSKHRRLHQQSSHEDDAPPEKAQKRDFSFILEDPGSSSRDLADKNGHPMSSSASLVTTAPITATATLCPVSTDAQGLAYLQNGGPTSSTNATDVHQHSSAMAGLSDILDANIDFSTFFQPWADNLWLDTRQWFTPDFYDAMREKSHMDDPLLLLHDDSQLFSDQRAWFGQDLDNHGHGQDTSVSVSDKGAMAPPEVTGNTDAVDDLSRVSSPPNVPSQDDGVAFAWNPLEKTFRQTQHISITERHPLFLRHNPRFDMAESTWVSIHDFLKPRIPNSDDFILPSLAVANVFLGLFFKEFYEQSPVLHLPTLDVDSIPPSLVLAMVVIGAVYSHVRQSRRFSILVLDRARQNLQQSMEADRGLTRDPRIIYAYALLVYTGLWCGNKGAFEMAEASRGALVTYIRRLPAPKPRFHSGEEKNAQRRWEEWIDSEFHCRLRWYVFMIDSQFPAILNLRGMMSLGEVCRWECPSDEQYWLAPNAKIWASLQNGASPPSAQSFSVAYRALSMPNESDGSTSPSLTSNPTFSRWTLFLVLSSLASQAADWSHDWSMNPDDTSTDTSGFPFRTPSQNRDTEANIESCRVERLQARENLLSSLDAWYHQYTTCRGTEGALSPSSYFLRASRILHGLVHIHLHTSVADIQDALGKGGDHAVQQGLSRLQSFFVNGYAGHVETAPRPPPESLGTFARAIENCVSIISDSELRAAAPYSVFGVFLNHVFLWAVVKASSEVLKVQLSTHLCNIASVTKSELKEALDVALSVQNNRAGNGDGSRVVLMHGAQSLVRLGTWGASLNLARLLQLRAEI
ncbi:c2h2 type zinc finger domain protein [Colletotrichum incanum]|uniref:C2h2 type zinc finger domain protein n=1 Tax=Colletotrichum incanum TaxID=1573173 RepID=A0A167A2Y0_COLIC|nr:c2h2 type zinc finger domain protein [Colletotrichum incanum]